MAVVSSIAGRRQAQRVSQPDTARLLQQAVPRPRSAEMSTGGDTPQPATASAVDAPNLAVSGGTLDPGVLEALQAAVRQEVKAAIQRGDTTRRRYNALDTE